MCSTFLPLDEKHTFVREANMLTSTHSHWLEVNIWSSSDLCDFLKKDLFIINKSIIKQSIYYSILIYHFVFHFYRIYHLFVIALFYETKYDVLETTYPELSAHLLGYMFSAEIDLNGKELFILFLIIIRE